MSVYRVELVAVGECYFDVDADCGDDAEDLAWEKLYTANFQSDWNVQRTYLKDEGPKGPLLDDGDTLDDLCEVYRRATGRGEFDRHDLPGLIAAELGLINDPEDFEGWLESTDGNPVPVAKAVPDLLPRGGAL
jgi:hypothetical protein